MNDKLQDIIKKSAAIKSAVTPLAALQNMFSNTFVDSLNKNKFPIALKNDLVTQIFKKPNYFDAAAIQDNLYSNKIKTFYGNPKLWDSIGVISKSQHDIASLFSTNAYLKSLQSRPQIATPSFASAIDPSLWGYNTKINTLQSTLKGISTQIALKSFIGIDANLLNSFTQTTKDAVAITQEITQSEYATTDSIAKLETFIGTSLEKFQDQVTKQILESGKSPLALISLWVAIIGILVTLFSIVQTSQSQKREMPQAASKNDIQELRNFVGAKFEEALKKTTFEAALRIDCNLRYKPSQKSAGFFKLKAGEVVHIISTRHKWVHVTKVDPADGLPVTGWILKKYIQD